MSGEYEGHSDYRTVTIMTSDGNTIQGKVNISAMERVSDLFTKSSEPFLVMVDAEFKDVHKKTLFINKDRIIWVEPEEI
jgi:hypothetical protein